MEPIKLYDPSTSTFNNRRRIFKDGVELEKGVLINQFFLDKNQRKILEWCQIFSAYPDVYLDLITPVNSNFKLFPYQRLFLRACMRYQNIFITASRATSKTFLSILAKYLQCMFSPNHVGSIVAPNKTQAAKISKQKIEEIWRIFPLLKKEISKANFGKDYVDLFFKNGSRLSIVGALDSDRGLRTHATLIDEARDQDGDKINEVVLPQMNIARAMVNGLVNPYERINAQVIWATSAGMKSSFAYEKLISTLEQAIIDPKNNFCIGLDYRIPVLHGLISKTLVEQKKLDPSYSDQTFAAEYMSEWLGGSEESWFNFAKLSKYRTIKNPELSAKYRDDPNVFYLISVDVGRLHDQTVAFIFRVNKKNEKFYSTAVNIEVLGREAKTKTFYQQAIDLKKLIARYSPREVVIDTNGLGVGLGDEMIREHTDEYGNLLPAYGFFNNDDYKKIQPSDAVQILFSMKANRTNNSKIHSNAYARLNGGLVRFLIPEKEARASLLATKKGARMNLRDRVQRLLPHQLTTKFFEEMANLRLKRTGLDITLEQINSRFPKDKYSAFAYGQWRIKELEEEEFARMQRKQKTRNRQLVFFTDGSD